jgi:hypothetical protein
LTGPRGRPWRLERRGLHSGPIDLGGRVASRREACLSAAGLYLRAKEKMGRALAKLAEQYGLVIAICCARDALRSSKGFPERQTYTQTRARASTPA